jgi:hypothetical protein
MPRNERGKIMGLVRHARYSKKEIKFAMLHDANIVLHELHMLDGFKTDNICSREYTKYLRTMKLDPRAQTTEKQRSRLDQYHDL